ncbi:MAG: FHA domain-containing protein [Gaiellales bacterium]|nr:MAG: FHA domain-containing protein [Gaiellales bacterium]
MLEPVLFGAKILFLLLLYLFIYRIVRSLARDLSRGAEPVSIGAESVSRPASPAAPAPRPAAPSREQRQPIRPKAMPPDADTTGEFEYLVTKIKPRLVVQHSKILDDGTEFKLRKGTTIGRSPGSEIVLPDEYVSQTHARIFSRKQFMFIEDLGSTNGTIVDGRRIEGEHQIKPGQEIVIGDTIFRYEE